MVFHVQKLTQQDLSTPVLGIGWENPPLPSSVCHTVTLRRDGAFAQWLWCGGLHSSELHAGRVAPRYVRNRRRLLDWCRLRRVSMLSLVSWENETGENETHQPTSQSKNGICWECTDLPGGRRVELGRTRDHSHRADQGKWQLRNLWGVRQATKDRRRSFAVCPRAPTTSVSNYLRLEGD